MRSRVSTWCQAVAVTALVGSVAACGSGSGGAPSPGVRATDPIYQPPAATFCHTVAAKLGPPPVADAAWEDDSQQVTGRVASCAFALAVPGTATAPMEVDLVADVRGADSAAARFRLARTQADPAAGGTPLGQVGADERSIKGWWEHGVQYASETRVIGSTRAALVSSAVSGGGLVVSVRISRTAIDQPDLAASVAGLRALTATLLAAVPTTLGRVDVSASH